MRKLTTIAGAGIFVALVALLALVVAHQLFSGGTAQAGHGSTPEVVDFVAVDADIAGNSSPTPGSNDPANPVDSGVNVPGETVQDCIGNVGIGEQVTIDVVVDEVDEADRMDSFQYQLIFDPAVVNGVFGQTSPDVFQMLAANTGSFPGNFALPVDNTTGVWGMVVSEQTPTDPGEFGNGVLVRHTFTGMSAGVSQLTLTDVIVVKPSVVPGGLPIPVTTVLNAEIRVDQPCPAPPVPPVADTAAVSTDEDIDLPITLTGSDASGCAGESYTFEIVDQPDNGEVTPFSGDATCVENASGDLSADVTYSPAGNFNGDDPFTFKFNDTADDSNVATVDVTVNPVNDQPDANPDTVSTLEDTEVSITLTGDPGDGTFEASQTLTFILASLPSAGTLSETSGGAAIQPGDLPLTLADPTIFFDPALNSVASQTFDFRVQDDGGTANGGIDTSTDATVTVTVNPINDAPTLEGIQDIDFAEEGSDNSIDLDDYFDDLETADADATFEVVLPVFAGITVFLDVDTHVLTVSGDPNFNGEGDVTVKATDRGDPDDCGDPGPACAAELSDEDTFHVTVNPVNDAPTADGQAVNASQDTPVDITLTGSDVETLLANLSFNVPGTTTQGGTLAVKTSPNVFTYTPPSAVFTGADDFTFTVTDRGDPDNCGTPNGDCTAELTSTAATVDITVLVNQPPVAVNDTATVDEDSLAADNPIDVLADDSDPENDPLTIDSVTDPPNGTAVIDDNGTSGNPSDDFVTYTPDGDYNGPDSFDYTISDGKGNTDTATVTVTVNPINDAPSLTGVSNITFAEEGSDSSIDLDDHYDDLETADANATFEVVLPVFAGISILLNPTTHVLTVSGDLNFNGGGDVTVKATDRGDPDNCGDPSATCAAELSVEDTFHVTVTPVNDAPTADGQTVTASEDTPRDITLTGSDVETASGSLTFNVPGTTTQGGTLVLKTSPNVYTYNPPSGHTGSDDFTFTVTDRGDPDLCGTPSSTCDAELTSNTATVNINVTPVNDAPDVTAPTSITVPEDGANTVAASISDVDDTVFTCAVKTGFKPAHGSVSFGANCADVTYTPDPDYNGPDSFTFTVTDSGGGQGAGFKLSDDQAVSVTVENDFDDPLVVQPDSVTVQQDSSGNPIDVLDNDFTDGRGLLEFTFDATTLNGGTVSKNNNGTPGNLSDDFLEYTPPAGFSGTDSFDYTITDSREDSGTATVTILVNAPPDAVDDSATVDQDSTGNVIKVLVNDSDPDGDTLTITSVSDPANGTAATDGSTVTYTPDAGFSGKDTFTYTISDGNGGTDTATVTITVAAALAVEATPTPTPGVAGVTQLPVSGGGPADGAGNTPLFIAMGILMAVLGGASIWLFGARAARR